MSRDVSLLVVLKDDFKAAVSLTASFDLRSYICVHLMTTLQNNLGTIAWRFKLKCLIANYFYSFNTEQILENMNVTLYTTTA